MGVPGPGAGTSGVPEVGIVVPLLLIMTFVAVTIMSLTDEVLGSPFVEVPLGNPFWMPWTAFFTFLAKS